MIFIGPRINDITTTPEAPPQFQSLKATPYPSKNILLQKKAYPDLGPIRIKGTLDEAFKLALNVARTRMTWKVVSVDASTYRFEAVATTRLLRFKDDVVVEIRPGSPGGAIVHVRSRSRLGRSDFGANAKRIREFRAAITTR